VWCQPGNTLAAVGVIWRLTRYSYGGDSHRIQNVGVVFGKLKNNKITYRYRLFFNFLNHKASRWIIIIIIIRSPALSPCSLILLYYADGVRKVNFTDTKRGVVNSIESNRRVIYSRHRFGLVEIKFPSSECATRESKTVRGGMRRTLFTVHIGRPT